MTKNKVTILVLTLNERIGVEEILPKIKKSWYYQILIIDGGSTDGTIEWCEKNNYKVIVQRKKGIRHGYIQSIPFIKGDYVLTFSPDGNCDPLVIPNLIKEIVSNKNDLVIGSRYFKGERSDDDDFITKFGNWFFTKTVNLLFSGNLTDVMVIFRIFRKNLINELDLVENSLYSTPERLFNTIISWEPIMSVRAIKKKKKISEILAHEYPRIGGERKLQIIRWGLAYYFQFLSQFFSKK